MVYKSFCQLLMLLVSWSVAAAIPLIVREVDEFLLFDSILHKIEGQVDHKPEDVVDVALVQFLHNPVHSARDRFTTLRVEAFRKRWDFELNPINLLSPSYSMEMLEPSGNTRSVTSQKGESYFYIGQNSEGRVHLCVSYEGGLHGSLIMADRVYNIRKVQTHRSGDDSLHAMYHVQPSQRNDHMPAPPEYADDVQEALFKREAEFLEGDTLIDNVMEAVELMVVVDHASLLYHGQENIERLVFGILGTVASLYSDPSLKGPAIQISLTKLILEAEPFIITMASDSDIQIVLTQFCQYQHLHLTGKDLKRHDLAMFLTRNDLCTPGTGGRTCDPSTVGLAPLHEMCSPSYSCLVIKDEGFASGFIATHEMGHSLGMYHDGPPHNDCPSVGYIMSSEAGGGHSYEWSNCSARYLRRFRGMGRTGCLRDSPQDSPLANNVSFPGYGDNGDLQCRLLNGPFSQFCAPKAHEVCKRLWCQSSATVCVTNHLPAVDGTSCGENNTDHICYHGQCVNRSVLSHPVHGGWGDWSIWSSCSKTCGGGVVKRKRLCNKPQPKFGGRHCQGDRMQAKYCKTEPCAGGDTFRQEQCERFAKSAETSDGEFATWQAVKRDTKCLLYCKGSTDVTFVGAADDGTSCSPEEGYHSAVCITGKCWHVGCDDALNGRKLDRCGVCGGLGDTCEH